MLEIKEKGLYVCQYFGKPSDNFLPQPNFKVFHKYFHNLTPDDCNTLAARM